MFTAIVLGFLSLFPLAVACRYPPFLIDDAFITLTYAKNLAGGNGFVFNQPPPVLGTTTPLFTLLVAGLATMLRGVDIPVLAIFLSAGCWLGIPWLFFAFRKAWGLANGQVIILALVVFGSAWVSFLGMEPYLFACLLVLSLSLFLAGRAGWAGLAAGLLFLTRGEGVLVCGVLVIALAARHWRQRRSLGRPFVQEAARLAIGFAIPALAWAAYAQLTFGAILPNTLAAKQAQNQSGLGLSFVQRLTQEWIPIWRTSFAPPALPALNVWWGLALIGLIDALRRKRQWLLLAGWTALYFSGYVLLDVSAYWWYQLPILFTLDIFFALGMMAAVEALRRRLKPPRLSAALAAGLVIVLAGLLALPTINGLAAYQGDGRGASYTALSGWFRQHADPSASVAFIEIGYLGYFTPNRIIDLDGLILPDVVPHIAARDFSWAFWHYQPDYYVYLPDFDWALAGIRADPRFDQQYRATATLPGPRQTEFTIYERIRNAENMNDNSPIETIGIYNCYTGLPVEAIPFFKACGYNTYQRWDMGWTKWPSRHESYYAEMANDVRRMQAAGFKVFVLLSMNMAQRQAGEPEGYGETYYDPSDEVATRQRLAYVTQTVRKLKHADGFTLFAGDPGGHRNATPAHLLASTTQFLALIAREAPQAEINVNTWGIAAWDRFTSPFDVAFWEKEAVLSRDLFDRLDLATSQAGLEFPLHNYYRSLALHCYNEAGKHPDVFPSAAEVAGLRARGVKRLWGWPYFLADECDDGYRPGTAGITQSETRYLKQLIDAARRLGLNGMIANAFEANILAESLNLYAFARFCKDPAATPGQVIGEFATFIAEPHSVADMARIIAFVENRSTWQAGLPVKHRLPDFDAGASITAQDALAMLAGLSLRSSSALPLTRPPAAYVDGLIARLEMLAANESRLA